MSNQKESLDQPNQITSDTGYFSIVPEWVLDHPQISHGAVRLYGILCRYADSEGRSWPSRRTLAKRLNCTVLTVDRWAAQLTKNNALTIVRRKNKEGTANLTNIWIIHRVASSVIPPSDIGETRLVSPVLPKTRTNKTKPNKKGTALLDELIEEESK